MPPHEPRRAAAGTQAKRDFEQAASDLLAAGSLNAERRVDYGAVFHEQLSAQELIEAEDWLPLLAVFVMERPDDVAAEQGEEEAGDDGEVTAALARLWALPGVTLPMWQSEMEAPLAAQQQATAAAAVARGRGGRVQVTTSDEESSDDGDDDHRKARAAHRRER